MTLLTIGAFARAAGLTPKALRLYDRLGLVPPAAVDPESGYRLYDPAQLRRARLVAELRRIDMPLAEIRTVCELPPEAAAEAVGAYWRRVSADTEQRGRLAALLVEDLTGRESTMTSPVLALRWATACETGAVRRTNEDAVHADDRLLAVADGGAGPLGAAAAQAAIGALTGLDPGDAPALLDAVSSADRAIRDLASDDHGQPITTLTALVRDGSRLSLVHVGDSRAYLLRGGELVRLTQDHTWVQAQVDAGKLRADEAVGHPQRALLVRALGAGGPEVEADLAVRTAQPGDRYLLCTDGLSAVVAPAALHAALVAGDEPGEVVRRMIELVGEAGAPDNVACVVADVVAA